MAAKIGILGESTVTNISTTTVYTVPADKSARIRILIAAEGGSGTHTVAVSIGGPNDEIVINLRGAGNEDGWTGISEIGTPDPVTSILESYFGLQQRNFLNLASGASLQVWIIAPLHSDYFLSTGDTVKVIIGTQALADGLFQVQGVEDDA